MRREALNPHSPVPLYYQLQELIRQEIEEGELTPDKPLPTEAELAQRFDVSRTTVREALRGLVERGLIVKRQGVGSFVAEAKLNEVIPGLISFTAEMRARGFTVLSRVLEQGAMTPPPRVLKALQLTPDSQVTRVARLRFVDDEPIAISTSYMPPEISPDEDFGGSLCELLKTKYGYHVISGRTSIEAGLAGDYEAKLLGVEKSSAVLLITWQGMTENKRPIEYSEGCFRGDRYRYMIHLNQ